MLKLTKIFLLLLVSANFAQSSLLTLMNDEGLAPYPKTDDLVASYDENEMTVSNWSDQTGTADFLQPTAGNQPQLITNALNGYPALRFDGSDNFMLINTFELDQPITIYFVTKNISWADDDKFLIYGDAYPVIAEGGGGTNLYTNAGGGYLIRSFGVGEYKIGAVTFNGASSVFQVNDNTETGDIGTVGSTTTLSLCGTSTGASAGNFEVAALYIHSTAHDLATRTEIIGWLNEKYGVY